MTAEVMVLRVVHIVGGMFWVGATMFMSFFLAPVLASMGPAAGPVMGGLARRRLMTILPVAAVLTMLSGTRLMMIASAGFQAAYFHSPSGRAFAWGGTIAIVAFVFGMGFSRPAMMKAGALSQQLASATDEATRSRLGAEIDAARRRGTVGGAIVLTMLLVAVVLMSIARYMN